MHGNKFLRAVVAPPSCEVFRKQLCRCPSGLTLMHSNCLTGERDLCDLLKSTHQPIFPVALKKFQYVSVVAAHGSHLDISEQDASVLPLCRGGSNPLHGWFQKLRAIPTSECLQGWDIRIWYSQRICKCWTSNQSVGGVFVPRGRKYQSHKCNHN